MDLQKIFNECLFEIKSLNIPVGNIRSIEWTDMDDAWGLCGREWINDHFCYIIKISTAFLTEKINIKELRTTICHEILHSCPRCWGHKKTWVKYALKVDKKYGYEVATYKTEYDVLNSELPTLHQMICPNCGGKLLIKKQYIWEQVKDGDIAHCGWCASKMNIVF